ITVKHSLLRLEVPTELSPVNKHDAEVITLGFVIPDEQIAAVLVGNELGDLLMGQPGLRETGTRAAGVPRLHIPAGVGRSKPAHSCPAPGKASGLPRPGQTIR